jgi:SH3-like domain-containing protein
MKDSRLKRTFFTLSIFIAVISLSSLYLNYEKKELSNIKFAIIFDKEVEVWSEPNKISELKFLLHEGTKVKQVDLIEDWVNIQLDNGTLGWIEVSSLRFLN